MQKSALRLVAPTPINGTVPPRRKPNSETRDREHLTEAEVERSGTVLAGNRFGGNVAAEARPVLNDSLLSVRLSYHDTC